MTQAQAIETIKQMSPEMSDTQVTQILQRVVVEFCTLTELLRANSTDTTQANVRYYPLAEFTSISDPETIIKINRVDFNNEAVDHLSGEPSIEDLTEAAS
jgi:hypothetical protein